LRLPRVLHPFALLVVAWAAGILPLAFLGREGGPASAVALAVLSVAQPASALFVPRWWLHTVVGVIGWVALATVLGEMPAVTAMREGAMIYMPAFLGYPATLALTCAIRFVTWIVGRRRCARQTCRP